jgi:predicted phosphoadenosine phosphosulfate sulfurtransferase
MATKAYIMQNVLDASRERVSKIFDHFERYYISFSGGKDSTVMTHLVMDEAIKRGKKVGLLIIDLEAQYKHTIDHIREMVEMYKDHIELHWFCGEILLRNAVSDFP